MKKRSISWAIAALLGLFLTGQGARAQEGMSEEAVVQVLDSFDRALLEKDGPALASLTDASLTYGHSSGTIQDKEAFLADVLGGPFRFLSISRQEQQVVLSGNVAVARFILSADATNAGTPAQVRIGVMMVLKKEPTGTPVLLARQAYKL